MNLWSKVGNIMPFASVALFMGVAVTTGVYSDCKFECVKGY
jgi:hypothetical protein